MRSEREMFDLILGVAEKDARIRAVVMNGSRANSRAKRDLFQDYDIGYIVDDVAPFLDAPAFIAQFGQILILQRPEESALFPSEMGGGTMYLMQFKDGARIDLNISTLEMLKTRLAGREKGEPMVALLDKDGILPELPGTGDDAYHVRQPSAAQFRDCCNEFFWVQPYIAKAVWRDQLPLAMHMLNSYSRDMLHLMMDWKIGVDTGFSVSTGKNGANYKKYIPEELYFMYLMTFPPAVPKSIYEAVFVGCAMFRALALTVAAQLDFEYDLLSDQNVVDFIGRIQRLPPDAVEL